MLFQWNHRMASLRAAGGHGQQTLCLDPRQIQRINQQTEFLFGKEHVLEPNFAALMPVPEAYEHPDEEELLGVEYAMCQSTSFTSRDYGGQYKRLADRVRDDPILSGLAIPLPNINAKSISTFISREEKKTNYAATVRPEVTPHLKVLSDMLFPEAPALPSPLPPPDRPQVQYQHVHHKAGKRRGEKRRLFVDEPQPVIPVNQPVQPTALSSSTQLEPAALTPLQPRPPAPTPLQPRPPAPTPIQPRPPYGPPPVSAAPILLVLPTQPQAPSVLYRGPSCSQTFVPPAPTVKVSMPNKPTRPCGACNVPNCGGQQKR
ncbi:hypothetical protein ACEWY4_028003 [Coilia grayii]|uniref:Uncharacterized protein n=1 Tax=Coilia grayii TaxID=363190 RepID=A0ABD1IN20_9TELE